MNGARLESPVTNIDRRLAWKPYDRTAASRATAANHH